MAPVAQHILDKFAPLCKFFLKGKFDTVTSNMNVSNGFVGTLRKIRLPLIVCSLCMLYAVTLNIAWESFKYLNQPFTCSCDFEHCLRIFQVSGPAIHMQLWPWTLPANLSSIWTSHSHAAVTLNIAWESFKYLNQPFTCRILNIACESFKYLNQPFTCRTLNIAWESFKYLNQPFTCRMMKRLNFWDVSFFLCQRSVNSWQECTTSDRNTVHKMTSVYHLTNLILDKKQEWLWHS